MRTNFIVWLSLGVVIGWVSSRMYEIDRKRHLKRLAEKSAALE